MKERPILFSSPMARALLDGTKTQTRRIVKSPNVADAGRWAHVDGVIWQSGIYGDHGALAHGETVRCPYGEPGDRLWVRETWRVVARQFDTQCGRVRVGYAADGETRLFALAHSAFGDGDKYAPREGYSPSIHMPRWASRLVLEVTDVRVERLCEITESDAKAEGVTLPPDVEEWTGHARGCRHTAEYAVLWETINGSGSWSRNSWVWVVSFRRVAP